MQRTSDRWYAGWFNQDYLDLYANRSTQEARTLRAVGFDVAELFGDYHGGAWRSSSPRAIVIAGRRTTRRLSLVSASTNGTTQGNER